MNPVTSDPNARGLVVRCVYIPRHHYGFGFTLRHFIVYPPELYANDGSSGESNNVQSRIGQVTEPVDTIFVKSVREHGPAAYAGLCVGDRVVSVNGETIAGKSYDQVVHLIQRSPSTLCLEVTPKQYDTLQLFYEEKAYRPETNQRPSTQSVVAPSSSSKSVGGGGGSGANSGNGLGLNSISILVNHNNNNHHHHQSNNSNSAETYQFYHNNYHLPLSLQQQQSVIKNQQFQNQSNHNHNNHQSQSHSLHHYQQQQQQREAQALYSLPSYNSSYESVFLPNFDQSLNSLGNMSSTSTYTNSQQQQDHQQQQQQKHNQQIQQQQQLFSHLPRPTPYKSTVVWSHLTPSQQQQQQQQQQHQQHLQHQEQQHILSLKQQYISGSQPGKNHPLSHQHQPQTYYPFNLGGVGANLAHRGILRDETGTGNSGAKSHESVLDATAGDPTDTSNRYGSMECLPSGGSNSAAGRVGGSNFDTSIPGGGGGGNPWKIPGYRYSISTGPSDVDLRRESTISLPPSSSMVPSYQNQSEAPMLASQGQVQGGSGSGGRHPLIDTSGSYSLDGGGGEMDHSSLGYEGKMVDRIRRSCEQKEEFLKRPNQPLVWAPITPNSAAAAGFPKELYAQPQKFQKVPWPPANVNVNNPGYGLQQSMSTPTASSIGQSTGQHVSRASSASEPFRYTNSDLSSPSHRKSERTTTTNSESASESSFSSVRGSMRPIDWTLADYGSAKNRLTVVGSGKLHCDPPPGWKPPPSVIVHPSSSASLPPPPGSSHETTSTIPKSNGTTTSNDETEYYVQNRNDVVIAHGPVVKSKKPVKLPVPVAPSPNSNNNQNQSKSPPALLMRPIRPNHLLLSKKLIFKNNHNHSSSPGKPSSLLHPSLDTDVILRKRENDPDYDNDRVVRRVSYLKATSSPIDMERKSSKSSSPTTPTKSSCDDENVLPLPNLRKSTTDPGTSPGRRRSMANKLSSDFLHKGRIVRLRQFFEDRTQPSSLFKFHADSPSAEFRHFGSFRSEKSPDDSEIIKDGSVHFKVRAGENKKVGYYRSWRQGWAQIRRSGCLYLSKERITKDSISGMDENAAILCVGLKDGISIEPAEDYSKRKYVLRVKTTNSASTPNGGGGVAGVSNVTILTSPAAESINAAALLPHVEILIQADDPGEMMSWLKSLQQQQDNNNYSCANTNKQQNNSSNSNSAAIGTVVVATPHGTTNINNSSNSNNSSNEFTQKSSIFKSLLPSQGGFNPPSTGTTGVVNTFLSVNSAGVLVSSNPTSPKSKTWKGKVAKQWKKMQHLPKSSPSQHGSGYNPQGPIPETGASFGVLLDDCPVGENNPAIPRVMEICVNTIESRGLGITGIYRIPGNSAAVAALTDSLNKGNEPNPDLDPRWNDVHVISSMLKSFLRNLPDPLLTSERYQDFIRGVYDAEEDVQFERIKTLIDDLPEINYETLRYLILHLKKVSENSERNRMESRNLAIVFGPTLVRTADDSVASMVNDMKQQCKLVELLINLAYQFFPPHNQNSPPIVHSASEIQGSSISALSAPLIPDPVAKFESDIRASLIQAAQRKVSRQHLQPSHNTYGLPMGSASSNPIERGSVDESGQIRSYAGLGAETEQRVRQFEMETRAMLTRDGRSPNPTSNSSTTFSNTLQSSSGMKHAQLGVTKNSQNPPEDAERIRLEKLRLEAEWRKAKDDLENEDFYDQLADNPSSIVHHKEHGLPPFPLLSHNVSSSSVSSSNSAGGNTADGNEALSSGLISPSMNVLTWPMKLGPTPFKPTYSQTSSGTGPSLPPKPPHVTLNSSSSSSSSTTTKLTKVLTVSNPSSLLVGNPLRKVSSVEHLTTNTGGTKIRDGFIVSNDRFDSSKVTGRETLTRLKRNENKPAVPYDPKLFGSLDSLRDIVNGGSKEDLSPRSSDGSDLVASMSRALDQRLSSLRPSITRGGGSSNLETEDQHEGNNITEHQEADEEDASEREETSVKFSEGKVSDPTWLSDGEDSLSHLLNSMKINFNGINKGRSRSLIERRKDLDEEEVEKATEPVDRNGILSNLKLSYRDPSLHRVSNTGNGSSWSGDKPGENGEEGRIQPTSPRSAAGESEQFKVHRIQHQQQRQPSASLTKEAKTASNNRLTKESQRRHSLSGTVDILRFLGGHASSGTHTGNHNHGRNVSTDTLTTALAANNILESHV